MSQHSYGEGDPVWVQEIGAGTRVMCRVAETYWIGETKWLVAELKLTDEPAIRFVQRADMCHPVSS